MKLTLGNFNYLGICLEDFLFGELFVLQLRKPCLNKFKITLYQVSILAYLPCICIIMHPRKRPATTKNKNRHSMRSVPCMSYLRFSLFLIPCMFGLTRL